MRVEKHPILGDQPEAKMVTIIVDGKKIQAREGEMVAAALTAAGIRTFRKTPILITVLLQNPKTCLQSKKAVLKYILQEGS